jgi:hypothetical protein
MPNQMSTANPGTALSAIVGTCGSIGIRCCVATPNTFALACSTNGMTATGVAQMSGAFLVSRVTTTQFASGVQDKLQQPFVVENRPGGGLCRLGEVGVFLRLFRNGWRIAA